MIQTQTTIRAAMYARSATVDQHDGDQFEEQIRACRQLAGSLGAEVVTEHRDIGSGRCGDRLGLQTLLEAARRQDVGIVVCERPDRLARGVAKLREIEEELASLGVTVHYAVGDRPERRALTAALASLEALTHSARKAR